MPGVVQLNKSHFKKVKGKWIITHPAFKGKQGLVVFKMKWCGYCQKLEPEYKQAAQLTGNAFILGAVEGTQNENLIAELGITSFPTIRYVQTDGTFNVPYDGDRSTSGLLTNICSHVRGTPSHPSPSFCSRRG